MRRMLRGIAAAAAVAGLAAVLPAAQAQDVSLRMAHIYPPGNIWYDAAEAYKQAVEERSGGSVTITIDHSGMTGDWPQSIEGLLIGTNDIVLQSIGTLDRYDTIAGIEAYPYLVRDLDHFKAVYFGALGGELFEEIREKTGFKIVGAGYRGARHMSSSRAVRSVEDLNGVKLRVPPLRMYRLTWELLGASPVPMGVAELFTSLQQRVVDGQENPLEVIESQRFDEVQDYVVETAHVIGAMTFIFHGPRFAQLSEEVQALLQEEGDRVMLEFSDRMAATEQEIKQRLQDKGMEFIEVDRAAFQAKLDGMLAEFPELAGWVERIQASAP